MTEDRIDRDCSLLAAVRRLLPAKAIATHSGACADADGRLFLAVSKHEAPRPKALKHWTLKHQTPKRGAPGRETL